MYSILDHEWRWKHLYYIRSEEGIVKIQVRPEQQVLHDIVYAAFFAQVKEDVVILKDRQRGTSTDCNLICEDLSAYYPGKVANTLADTRDRAGSMFENNVKFAWDRIPDGLKPKAEKDNVNELNFSGIGSKYIVSASKSEPVDILHISEAPYFQDEGKITEAEQMLRKNGIEIMESTAYGVGNLFENRFTEAWAAKKAGKKHHRKALFFPWFTNPKNTVPVAEEYKNKAFIESLSARIFRVYGVILTDGQKHFYDQKFNDLGEEVFQFYPTEPEEAFLHSGRPVFDLESLKSLEEKYARAPIRTEDGICIYEEPKEDKTYGIGVDTAEGLAHGDNASIIVQCRETGEQVAECTGKIANEELAEKLGYIARMYDNSPRRDRHLAVIERNNHGHAVIAYAKQDPSISLYTREVKDKITDETSFVIGWDTNEKSKAFLITTIRKDMRDGQCIPRGYECYDELRTYVHGERGIMGAIKGKHDDRVIASALANLACREMVIVGSLDPADYGIY